MRDVDEAFRRAVIAAVDAAVEEVLAASPADLDTAPLGPYRAAMRRIKLLVSAYVADDGAYAGRERLLSHAVAHAAALGRMQAASGLFIGGDNIESPPDSAFAVNDACDTLELIRRVADPSLTPLGQMLDAIADAAMPAMIAGGVHTPNHRWELTAALARLYRRRPDVAVHARAEQWLAEGIDQQTDGMYSERSANYAAYVSNPSLVVIGDVFDRPDLHDVVVRNLDATLGLIHPDGSVETTQSRRQDQRGEPFPLAPYLLAYRRFAIERGRGDFAWAAEHAAAQGIAEPHTVLTELLLDPWLARPLPEPEPPAARRREAWSASGLVVDANPARTLVLYGGSDYPRQRRIRSGLASNPTFLRMFAGEVVLDSVRLSRDFFGLGPFRAAEMAVDGDAIILTEQLEGHYYQPLERGERHADGAYDLADEGRFAAAMAFSDRQSDAVALRTRVAARPTDDGVELEIMTDGPALPWALELSFREGGAFSGAAEASDGSVRLDSGTARYRVGGSAVEFGPGTGEAGPARYHPGEDYTYLGATDAVDGRRAYIVGRTPGVARVRIRAI
ncbi:hypothetical protein [Phytoactinopolyspora halotolerans]|uniref:Uncharacterized protein n=1 Tax=Phytoactinopolyspora halotolerans TaxID=1981512 RepID=A0A6L9SDN0_9ACTN|nr:hypothetical protein [Phytoactinopolyspora halotolerans]NEE03253.1 hypothetical protein [Phytoactinopolyspora halotolerans]